MARRIPLPSFLSTKRSKVITVATAGTLALAAGVSAAVVAFPSSSSPMPATADAAFMTAVSQRASAQTTQPAAAATQTAALSKQAHALQAKRFEQQVTTAKATANAVAAHKAAAAAAASRAATRQTTAQAATQQTAAQQAAVSVPSGSPEQVAEQMLSQFGWSSSQFSCLQPLWQQESGWSLTAENPSSGAYGIPQALPGSQMASAGPDWQTNAATQIRWGLTYIQSRYGSPCGAWAHEEADGWY